MVDKDVRRKQERDEFSRSHTELSSTSEVDSVDSGSLVEGGSKPESVVERARKSAEAAGLAHWTEPATGRVPKGLTEKVGGADSAWGGEGEAWPSSDFADGRGTDSDLSDPTADLSGPAIASVTQTRDPLADIVSSEADADHVDLTSGLASEPDKERTGHALKMATAEVGASGAMSAEAISVESAIGSDLEVQPSSEDLLSTIPDTTASVSESVESGLTEIRHESSDLSIDLDDVTDSAPDATPDFSPNVDDDFSVFDTPPSEQIGAAKPIHRAHEPAADEQEPTPQLSSRGGFDEDDEADSIDSNASVSQELTMVAPDTTTALGSEDSSDRVETSPPDQLLPEVQADGSAGEAEPQSKGSGRNLGQAIAVGVALAVVAGVATWLGPIAITMLIGLFGLLAIVEFFDAMKSAGLKPATLLGVVGVAGLQAAVYFEGPSAYSVFVGLAVLFGVLWYLVGVDDERPALNLGLTLMGLLWVGGLSGFGVLIATQENGIGLLIATIVLTVASDTLAYLGGRAFGSTPFHSASPNKTWEGTLTGFAGALFFGLAIGLFQFFPIFGGGIVSAVVLAAVVGVLAPVGDLAESMMKRDLGVKDMGTLLPGHGGVMDRLDGLLFALPGAYFVGMLFSLF